jgi:hypothetical protein
MKRNDQGNAPPTGGGAAGGEDRKPKPPKGAKGDKSSADSAKMPRLIAHLSDALALMSDPKLREQATKNLVSHALLTECGKIVGLSEMDRKAAYLHANLAIQGMGQCVPTLESETGRNQTQVPVKPAAAARAPAGVDKGNTDKRGKVDKAPADKANLPKKLRLPCGAEQLAKAHNDLYQSMLGSQPDNFLKPLTDLKMSYDMKQATVEVEGKASTWQSLDFAFLFKREIYDRFEQFIIKNDLIFDEVFKVIPEAELTEIQKFFWQPTDDSIGVVVFKPLPGDRAREQSRLNDQPKAKINEFPIRVIKNHPEGFWTISNAKTFPGSDLLTVKSN